MALQENGRTITLRDTFKNEPLKAEPTMPRLLILIVIMGCSLQVMSQNPDPQYKDPQNMKVDPENTDCHLLPKEFDNLDTALETIENSRFYYDQSIKTTRRSGLMYARYVSCDFNTGYLVIRYDGEDQVYPNVKLELWQQLQNTADIDGYYFKHIENLPTIDP